MGRNMLFRFRCCGPLSRSLSLCLYLSLSLSLAQVDLCSLTQSSLRKMIDLKEARSFQQQIIRDLLVQLEHASVSESRDEKPVSKNGIYSAFSEKQKTDLSGD